MFDVFDSRCLMSQTTQYCKHKRMENLAIENHIYNKSPPLKNN